MRRKPFELLAFLITCLGLACTDNPGIQQPNFLVLIADDLGWQDLACYGNPFIETPNIDRIAKEGLQCNNTFLTTAQCSPSRISILSGKYPHATGAEDLHIPMPDSLKILPYYLKEKGYYSGLLRKSHLGPKGDAQFDWYSRPLENFSQFLDSAGQGPFFLWVGFIDPHRPYKDDIIHNPQSPDSVLVPPYLVDDDSTRLDLANYYNEIRRMDARIGEYLSILEQRNVLNNTYIIFLSDNGAPFPRAKGTVYDAGIKTPLLIQGPGIRKGRQSNNLHSVIDLSPTILELAGLDVPTEMQGNSIVWDLKYDTPDTLIQKMVFSERNWHNTDEHIRSVRTSQFKLIENAYLDQPSGVAADIGKSYAWRSLLKIKASGKLTTAQTPLFHNPRPKYELYDLQNDPNEIHNLSSNPNYTEIKTELIAQLEKWKAETGDFPPTSRRRPDNTDRETGIKFSQVKVPDFIEE